MALEKIRPRVIDETGNYTFNNVVTTGSLISGDANIGNIVGITNLVASTTSITITGSLSTTSNISAGNIKTNNLQYANGNPWIIGASSTPPGGSNTQVQFNDTNSFGASANFTFNTATNTLVVTNISGNGAQLSSLVASNITGQVANALVSGTVYSNAQPNITSIGTLTSLDVTNNFTSGNANLGNATTSNYFIGNGSLLSSISGSNVTGQVGYAAVSNSVSGSNVVGQVTFAATANAVAGANVMGAVGQSTYADTANAVAGANVSGTVSSATTAGTVTTAAQPNITSVGTLTSLTSTGNITGGNLIATGKVYASDIINGGTGIYLAAGPSGYINFFTSTGDRVSITDTGNVNAVGTINGANLTTGGNITGGNANLGNAVTANYFIGNGSLLTGLTGTDYGNSNVAAYLPTYTGNVNANFFVGSGIYVTGVAAATAATVTTNAQPNITSVGTLTNLIVGNATANTTFGNGTITATGNISFTGANVSLGDASNLKITGGTAGYFITTDGAGNLSWGAAAGGGGVSATGSNTQLQFNDGGVLGASANLVFDKTTNTFTTGRVVASAGANLGTNVANVYIGGGSDNQILKTDGSGNLTWIAQPVATMTVDNFTGDGTTTAFTLSTAPTNINFTVVNYNGAFQLRSAYSISGTTITFSEAPVDGSLIEVTTTSGATSGAGSFVTRTYTGNGVATTYTVTSGVTVSSVIVTENGLVQTPTVDYTISGTTLTFVAAPANGTTIQIRELAIAIVTSPNISITSISYPSPASSASTSGGQTITITGGGFNSGAVVYVDTTSCSTTYVSATSLTFTSPAKSAGSYHVFVYNTNGISGMKPAGITYT